MNPAGHLSPAEAAAFVRRDGLTAAERLAISDHAAACAACRALVAEARGGQGAEAKPDLARAFGGLIEAGRQEENPARESWLGAEEFSVSLPELQPAEREVVRALETRMSRFEREEFVPGGTFAPASREAVAKRVVTTENGGWWQRLVSWQGLTLAGALAAVVLALAVAVPPGMHTKFYGPAAMLKSAPKAELVDGPVQVGADGTLRGLAAIPAELRDAVLETVRRGAAPGALLGKLTRGGGPRPALAAAENDPTAPRAVSPVGTSSETDQPTFRWQAGTPTALEIVVRPSAGGEEVRSLPLPAGTEEWTPPTPLTRGALYRWQIVAVAPEGQETETAAGTKPGAVFKVLSADAHDRLEALRGGPSGQSHLTLGVAYAREGLKEESAREFRALQEGNARSVLAKRLVDSLEGKGG